MFDPTDEFLTKTSVKGDVDELKNSLRHILQFTNWPAPPASPTLLNSISINLKRTDRTPANQQWSGLSGHIRRSDSGKFIVTQQEYTIWNEKVPKYIRKLVAKLETAYQFRSGRVRLSNLPPMVCLRSHSDLEQRFHLAITTNPDVFFYNNTYQSQSSHQFSGFGYHIPVDGFFYKANTYLSHTAINSGNSDRIHLVVDIVPSDQL